MTARSTRSAMAYHAGEAAERQVCDDYLRRGYELAARRWRGQGGEIDLIFRDTAGVVFVEVKKSRDFARAAEQLGQRQMGRIYATAAEFLAGEPKGELTESRFDVALVDGTGRIQIIENAFGLG